MSDTFVDPKASGSEPLPLDHQVAELQTELLEGFGGGCLLRNSKLTQNHVLPVSLKIGLYTVQVQKHHKEGVLRWDKIWATVVGRERQLRAPSKRHGRREVLFRKSHRYC